MGTSEALVLQKATCEDCREATRKVEEDCLNGMLGPARARLHMSRKDRRKPERKAHVVYRDGGEEERLIGVDYLPGAMVLPQFSLPGILLGLDWNPDASVDVLQTVIGDQHRLRDPSIRSIAVQVPVNLISFARMLSKIALGMAHYRLGGDAFRPIGREFITTGAGHLGHYVGGYSGFDDGALASDKLHQVSLWHYQSLLVVTIQLFAVWNGPTNLVVVGEITHMPPELPSLHLSGPAEHRDKPPASRPSGSLTTQIQWDRISP